MLANYFQNLGCFGSATRSAPALHLPRRPSRRGRRLPRPSRWCSGSGRGDPAPVLRGPAGKCTSRNTTIGSTVVCRWFTLQMFVSNGDAHFNSAKSFKISSLPTRCSVEKRQHEKTQSLSKMNLYFVNYKHHNVLMEMRWKDCFTPKIQILLFPSQSRT